MDMPVANGKTTHSSILCRPATRRASRAKRFVRWTRREEPAALGWGSFMSPGGGGWVGGWVDEFMPSVILLSVGG